MDKFKELMTKKVGGVPVSLIAALVAAGLLYMAFRMKSTGGDSLSGGDPTDATATDVGGDLPDTSQPVFTATPTIFQPSGSGSSVAAVPQQDTNELWQRRALEGLLAAGVSYDVAASALEKYLNGEPLTEDEKSARDRAIAVFGVPPEEIPYAPDYPEPKDTDGHPPKHHGPKHHAPGKPTHEDGPGGRPNTRHAGQGQDHDQHPSQDHDDKHPGRDHDKHPGRDHDKHHGHEKGHGGNGGGRHIDGHGEGHKHYRPAAKKAEPINKTSTRVTRATASHNTAKHIAAKNGTHEKHIHDLNPHLTFPVRPGTLVRVQ